MSESNLSTSPLNLDEEIELEIKKYLSLEADKDKKNITEELLNLKKQINLLYWQKLYQIISIKTKENKAELEFSDEEKIFIDFGIVVNKSSHQDHDILSKRRLEEVNVASLACQYFSEYLSEKYRENFLEASMSSSNISSPEDISSTQISEARSRIFQKLAPLFENLPGIPLETQKLVLSGKFDEELISLSLSLLNSSSRPGFLLRRHMCKTREQILSKAKARTNKQSLLKLFDILDEVYLTEWQDRYDEHISGENQSKVSWQWSDNKEISSSIVSEYFMINKVKCIKYCLDIESFISGENYIQVLSFFEEKTVLGKEIVDFLDKVKVFDRYLDELPNIVITPGKGRAIFSWDLDLVILPLYPLVSTEDSLSTAFAMYHMLNDLLNNNSSLRMKYESSFPGANFETDFPVEYRAWMCRVVNGDVKALSVDRRMFFKDHIGPDITEPLLPANLKKLSPQTLGVILQRLEKQIMINNNDANLRKRLASIYWQEGNYAAAEQQYMAALNLQPEDSEIIISLALLFRSANDNDKAKEFFKLGAAKGLNSLWGIYCNDALEDKL